MKLTEYDKQIINDRERMGNSNAWQSIVSQNKEL